MSLLFFMKKQTNISFGTLCMFQYDKTILNTNFDLKRAYFLNITECHYCIFYGAQQVNKVKLCFFKAMSNQLSAKLVENQVTSVIIT